jgi:hypothetical protein
MLRNYSSLSRKNQRMVEFTLEGTTAVSRDDVREQLASMRPPLRILAENVDTGSSPIDFVALDSGGDLVIVLLGAEGEDLALFTRGLAHQSWVEAQIQTWRQLAPALEFSAHPSVEVLLVCPGFCSETCSAVARVGPTIQLVRARSIPNGTGDVLLFESLGSSSSGPARPQAEVTPDATPSSPFRSGLTEEDLRLSPEELQEFN